MQIVQNHSRPKQANLSNAFRDDVRGRWAIHQGTSRATSSASAERTAWLERSTELARWAIAHMANRADVWGGYIPLKFRVEGREKASTKPRVDLRGRIQLDEDILARHFAGRDEGHLVGLHAIGRDGACRWVCWDIDNHGSANAGVNLAYAVYLFQKLTSLGFTPLLVDSNGRGGFHLVVVFIRPIASERAFRFARWIISDHSEHGLLSPPETFPKQRDLEGMSYGNWLRLPGRHHTWNHWSKAWNGNELVAGHGVIDLIVGTAGDDPDLIPAPAVPTTPLPRRTITSKRRAIGDGEMRSIVRRAERYILKMPASVSGNHGHDRLLSAACVLWRFGLGGDAALSILDDFNARCIPPWPARDVARKWDEAAKKCGASEFGSFNNDRVCKPVRRPSRRVAIFNVGAV